MFKAKFLTVFVVCFISFFGIAAQSECGSKSGNAAAQPTNEKVRIQNLTIQSNQNTTIQNKMMNEETEPVSVIDIKILAEGSNGEIEEPFIYVARDAETFEKLKKIISKLPAASDIDFKKQAVVAAFGGLKNTGGYSVDIKQNGGKVSVALNSPPPDSFVTEALTAPYKIAALPVQGEDFLSLEVGENWAKSAQTYKVTLGGFSFSGGFAGRSKEFTADGTIQAWQLGELLTLKFNLSGIGNEKNRRLNDTASGTIDGEKISLARVDMGSMSEGPKPPDKASGTIKKDQLSLKLEPLPSHIADGYAAGATIEAVKVK